MTPPVVSIVSKKKSGKTTLIERLIPELAARGYHAGTVKHDTHGFDIDHEGKDTWRHKRAGAWSVVISSPRKLSLVKDVETEVGLDRIVTDYFDNVDVVITEGYKKVGKPQIEVFRSSAHASPLHSASDPGTLIAIVSDVPVDLGVPNFDLEDIAGVAEFIIARLLAPGT